jgi:hypothetical protein
MSKKENRLFGIKWGENPLYHRANRDYGDFKRFFLCGLRDLRGEKWATPPNTREPENQSEKGQSLVELAVSLPVILLIMLASFDFGMALFSYSVVRDAAQEGALYASFNPGNKAEIENRARYILPLGEQTEVFASPVDLTDRENVIVDITVKGKACEGATKGTANYVQVRVTYLYPILMPFTGNIIGSDTLRLRATASNVILQPPCK